MTDSPEAAPAGTAPPLRTRARDAARRVRDDRGVGGIAPLNYVTLGPGWGAAEYKF